MVMMKVHGRTAKINCLIGSLVTNSYKANKWEYKIIAFTIFNEIIGLNKTTLSMKNLLLN
ncbi:hypothetical protein AK51_02455 [Serratia nematodiphila DZ0503SBS1]|nr:hypothetical protein AK51_02455 [Serratia nematodiphila DZ0503SBS1]